MTNPNDPAFPKVPTSQSDMGHSWPGLTKREWLIGEAMKGLLTNSSVTEHFSIDNSTAGELIAKGAEYMADAVLARLSKQESK